MNVPLYWPVIVEPEDGPDLLFLLLRDEYRQVQDAGRRGDSEGLNISVPWGRVVCAGRSAEYWRASVR